MEVERERLWPGAPIIRYRSAIIDGLGEGWDPKRDIASCPLALC